MSESDTWKVCTGIASKGHVHCLVNHGERQYSDGKANHINILDGFWGYMKTKACFKRGITQAKFPLYLGEHIWRYNHREDTDKIMMKRILKLLEVEVNG